MNELFESLTWDSEFFGVSIARIIPSKLDEGSVTALLIAGQACGLHCLYFEADPDDPTMVGVVEQHGFRLVDVRVVLEHPFDNRPAPVPRYPVSPELVIGPPLDGELSRLQDISAQIGLTSRFDFDKNFGPGQSERLYRLWIKNACHGFADVVLVACWHQNGEAVGLITCVLDDSMGHIQLAGVHLDHRKRSVGTGLVQAALDWAKARGARSMQVVTQARNVPAQRLYQQMGFFTKSMTLYYHKWLSLER